MMLSKLGFMIAALAISAPAYAGGPVVVVDEGQPVVVGEPVSSLGTGAVVAGIAGLVLVAAIAGGNAGTILTAVTDPGVVDPTDPAPVDPVDPIIPGDGGTDSTF